MTNVSSEDLDASFDALSATALQVKAERDALLVALTAIACPNCDHTLGAHADTYGCEYDRGDGYVGDGRGGTILTALGPCGCKAEEWPEVQAAVEVLRRIKG